MKFDIRKNLQFGKYHVIVKFEGMSEDERKKIVLFGCPEVSVEPKSVFANGRFETKIPLFRLDHDFEFQDSKEANDFHERLIGEIRKAVEYLNALKDNFSDIKKYEF